MTDITKLNKDKSQQSLSKKITDLKTKIEQYKKLSNKVLLCDTSGSMGSIVEGGQRAIDVVQNVLDNFKGATIYEFNTTCHKVEALKYPRGSTNMADAFYVVSAAKHREIILLTDGAPDSEVMALSAAKDTKLKISIIYIGPQPIPKFLEKLAQASGGQFTSVELLTQGATKELENKVQLFLNA